MAGKKAESLNKHCGEHDLLKLRVNNVATFLISRKKDPQVDLSSKHARCSGCISACADQVCCVRAVYAHTHIQFW